VGFNDIAAGAVIDRRVEDSLEILNERAFAPDVESLGAVADGKDGLVEIERVLEQEFVDGGAGRIGGAAGGDGFFTVTFGVDIEAASGQKHTLRSSEQAGNALGGFVEGNDDGVGTGRLEGSKILRERAPVVFEVRGGGFGDGDARGHGETSLSERR
jgi:hypothetical protein